MTAYEHVRYEIEAAGGTIESRRFVTAEWSRVRLGNLTPNSIAGIFRMPRRVDAKSATG
jgi:hypothetical protein